MITGGHAPFLSRKKKFAGVLTLLKKSGIFISELNNNQTNTTMKYQIKDGYNTVLEETTNYIYACLFLKWLIKNAIRQEVEIQDETGMTYDEIKLWVESFYHLVEVEQ